MDDKKVNKLTARQERFCQEYINCLNGTEAAIKAGYSAKVANRIATENLSKLVIVNRLKELQKPLAEKLNITRDDILKEYQALYKSEPDGFLVKHSDRLKALELTAKMLGFNEPDKLDLTTKGESIQPSVVFYIPDDGRNNAKDN
jgi:phage terminase small subunit